MESFLKELLEGEIHQRDRLQFELKSDFIPTSQIKKNIYSQEFYFFIPAVLRVNKYNYSKQQFYRDQTNLIRYKTPELSLKEIIDEKSRFSPLKKIYSSINSLQTSENIKTIQNELKLLGNIVRSALRRDCQLLIEEFDDCKNSNDFKKEIWNEKINVFYQEIKEFYCRYYQMQEKFTEKWSDSILFKHFLYVSEFISNSISFYSTGLLDHLTNFIEDKFAVSKERLSKLILEEDEKNKDLYHISIDEDEDSSQNEYILYRKGLLNKFVLDSLLLNFKTKAPKDQYSHLIAGIAAGIAMLFYLLLFIFQGDVFVINSTPFVILTVILYILKDRLKDGIKTLYKKKSFKWFPDYTTKIYTSDKQHKIGKLTESFSFVNHKQLPGNIKHIRNIQFHTILETVKRPETVIYYKKELTLESCKKKKNRETHSLNTIFRFNIHQFLQKASNPYTSYLKLNSENLELKERRLPKVYHLNIIMLNKHFANDSQIEEEIKKFRLIVDKNGIKRIESL